VVGHRKHIADDRRRRDDRGGYQRRDDRGGYQGRDDRGGYQRRDDRGGYQGRDDRGGYQGRDERGGSERRHDRGFDRRDDRGGYQRRDDRGGSERRDDRGFDRRDDERDERFEEVRREQEAADNWTKYEARKTDGPTEVTEENGFAALGLPERLVERLARDAITEPFPIQLATIPDALAGRDVLGRGRTGSGKTLAFGLPTIARLAASGKAKPKRPRSLVLVPTRELAMQVSDALEPLVHVMGLRHKLVAGGLSYEPQISALARGVDVLIATPGRLADLLERGALELGDIEVTILDEADHMAEMGFMTEITGVLDQLPPGQRLLFSATLDRGIDHLVERYLNDPVTHSTDDAQASVTTMAHHLFLVEPQHKKVVTAELAARPGRTIVFARTKLGADRVASQLRESGVMAAALHGGLTQSARNRVLGAFRTGDLPVLVATDVAARGIHVDDVSLVLQIDPPADHKDYLHRSGRTARAGEEGAVVTLALPHQKRTMERLLQAAGVETKGVRATPGAEPVLAAGGQEPPGEPVDADAFRAMLEPVRKQRGQSRAPGPRPDRGRRDSGRGRGDRSGGGDRFGGGRREDVADGWRSDGKGGGRTGSRPGRFGRPRHQH
jgi:superfamily II DNA/RNA helicase